MCDSDAALESYFSHCVSASAAFESGLPGCPFPMDFEDANSQMIFATCSINVFPLASMETQ